MESQPGSLLISSYSEFWRGQVLKGTRARLPGDLAEELPTLLWLYHMGIVFFWIHDSSPKQIKTWRLMEQTVEIITRLMTIASLPLMRPIRRSTLRLLTSLREDVG
jgi:hypothetical protein